MKKTIQVNLSGQVFTLDDDAYELLSNYLNKIGRLYGQSAGKEEILSDIESRIVELLLERTGGRKEVITILDVQEVIGIMGNPEDFEDDVEDDLGGAGPQESREKRLFRDPEQPILGGVCSGLAYYFGVDPIWVRLAFAGAVVFFGTGIFFYILLWVIIPQAKTTSERLNMKGEPINIDSIGKTIEEELGSLGDRLSKGGERFSRGTGAKIERGVDKFANFLVEIFTRIFKLLGKFFGLVFLFVGISVIVVLFAGLMGISDMIHFGTNGWDSSYSLYEFGALAFRSGEWLLMAILSAVFLIGIPFIALIYGGVVLLVPKWRIPYLPLTLFTLWFLGIFLTITVAWNTARDFSKEEHITDRIDLRDQGFVGDTLALRIGIDPFDIPLSNAYYARNDFMIRLERDEIIIGNVTFGIEPTSSSSLVAEVKRLANASTYEQAGQRAEAIQFQVDIDSTSLTIPPYFSFRDDLLLRGQSVDVTLYVPVGTTVFIEDGMQRVISDVANVQNIYDPRMVNHYWQMTEEGLSCLDCDNSSETVTIE